MANTYTQLYFHVVFAVKGRANLVSSTWREQLYKYITGIITNKNQKLIIINGMPDHVHLLIGMKPDAKLSDLVRDIKANSSKFINEQKFVRSKFEWQTGFGAFTLGHSQLDTIVAYIKNQEEHHKKKSFREEYLDFLERYEIDFKPEYIFGEN
ncbi:MAG TPA: IS200/IS605 family transposase [Cyclobacteriaceae bacterium]|nr:IS200/IS605 family transposase [Cyclobacteriaceae bacterium]HNU41503.1 IS200/IS605 family transposase [Cyclobacteriaceae bacterium]